MVLIINRGQPRQAVVTGAAGQARRPCRSVTVHSPHHRKRGGIGVATAWSGSREQHRGSGGLSKRDKWSRSSLLRVPLRTLRSLLPAEATARRSSEYVARQSLRAGDRYCLLISRLKVRFLRGAPTWLGPCVSWSHAHPAAPCARYTTSPWASRSTNSSPILPNRPATTFQEILPIVSRERASFGSPNRQAASSRSTLRGEPWHRRRYANPTSLREGRGRLLPSRSGS